MGKKRGVYRVSVWKPEGKRPLGRTKRRWENNIKMDLQEVGFGDTDWIKLAQYKDRWRTLVNAVMNLWVP
jgi:ribosome biogenesis protein Nip4